MSKEDLQNRLQKLHEEYKKCSPEKRFKYILMAKPLQIALYKYTKTAY